MRVIAFRLRRSQPLGAEPNGTPLGNFRSIESSLLPAFHDDHRASPKRCSLEARDLKRQKGGRQTCVDGGSKTRSQVVFAIASAMPSTWAVLADGVLCRSLSRRSYLNAQGRMRILSNRNIPRDGGKFAESRFAPLNCVEEGLRRIRRARLRAAWRCLMCTMCCMESERRSTPSSGPTRYGSGVRGRRRAMWPGHGPRREQGVGKRGADPMTDLGTEIR